MPYTTRFENETNASAPAQQVTVVDRLPAGLDWSTFELAELGFGDTTIPAPPHTYYFETNVPTSYLGTNIEVHIQAGINLANGQISAHFYSIDPNTGLPPEIHIGFLPPENGTGRGQGHVSFIVRSKTNLVTGTVIRNVADISFVSVRPNQLGAWRARVQNGRDETQILRSD